MKTITILGSTGSIGRNTLDVIRRSRHLYRVFGLVAGQNVEELVKQILEFRPQVVCVATEDVLNRVVARLRESGWRAGLAAVGVWPVSQSRGRVASGVTFVMAAVVGVAAWSDPSRGQRAQLSVGEQGVAGGHRGLLMASASRAARS
jgi:1-deoxy-D-xylulose-5-phosphate reductoisomerase